MDLAQLKDRLRQYGQSHLLRYWDELNDVEKSALYHDLDAVDYEEMNMVSLKLFRNLVSCRM
jgi:hypothetical protein